MAQRPMSSILVTIRITVRIQESEVRNPDFTVLSMLMLALCSVYVEGKQGTSQTGAAAPPSS